MNKIIILSFLIITSAVKAQNNLLNILGSDDERLYVSSLFKGTKVVNGQSVKLQAEGVLQFAIQHRFGTLNSGFYNFYGLDNSQVRIGFEYGLKDWLGLGIARSSALKTVDANLKLRLKRQTNGSQSFPFTMVLNSAIFIKQYRWNELKDENFSFINQLSYAHQLLIARKINRDLTIQLSPIVTHYNLVEIENEPHDKYAIGVGGRHKLTRRVSLNTEYFYQLNDKLNNNVLSLGFDIETGGHVFQLHLSNSSAMIEPAFITKTNGSWLNGDIYFGFNISRIFIYNK
ncbi:DUF5777 family beta-barrel protein [Flavobacteriales bacterium]|nr:DUF5777 family beta-barrel protein [Flavobacteriales bacterium]